MRPYSAVTIAIVAPLFLSGPLQAEPAREQLRDVPRIAPGQLVAAPNAQQIVPIIAASQGAGTASVSGQAQKVVRYAGSYLNGIARAVKQAVVVQATSPVVEPPSSTAAAQASTVVANSAPISPTAVAAAPDAPRLVRGPAPAVRPAAPSAPVLVAAPVEVTRVARKTSATKIAVYTCHVGEDYSLRLKRCVPEAKSRAGATAVAAATSGVTAVRTIARTAKSGSGGSKTVLAGRIDGPGSGRMALGAKAKRK